TRRRSRPRADPTQSPRRGAARAARRRRGRARRCTSPTGAGARSPCAARPARPRSRRRRSAARRPPAASQVLLPLGDQPERDEVVEERRQIAAGEELAADLPGAPGTAAVEAEDLAHLDRAILGQADRL